MRFIKLATMTMMFGATALGGALAADEEPDPVIVKSSSFSYGKVYGGVAFVQDESFDFIGLAAAGPVTVGGAFAVNLEFDTGFTVGGSVGHRFGDAFGGVLTPRLELDINHTRASVSNEAGAGNGSNFNGGDQVFAGNQSVTFIGGNALVDFDLTGDQKILPFVGVGVGAAVFDSNVAYNAGAIQFNDTDVSIGFQVLGGIEYAVTENIALSVEGRYLRAFSNQVDRIVAATGVLTGEAEGDFSAASVSAGISYRF